MIIYRPCDRIPIKIGDFTLWVSPLTSDQQNDLYQFVQRKQGKETEDRLGSVKRTLQYCVKGLDGVKTPEGKPLKLKFKDGMLTSDSVEDLFYLGRQSEVVNLASKLLNNRLAEISEIEGVEIDLSQMISVKKKG